MVEEFVLDFFSAANKRNDRLVVDELELLDD